MNNYQKFKLYVWPNTQKEKEGKLPLYIRVSIDSKKATIATRFYINPTLWDKKTGKIKLGAPNAQLINAYLDRACNQLQQNYLNAIARGEQVTAQELKEEFLGTKRGPNERTLMEAINFHNDKFLELAKSGHAALSTWRKYNTTKNKIEAFLKYRFHKKDVALNEIRYSFAPDLEHYLFTREKLQVNTVYKTIKQLKKILRTCVDMEWIQVNPIDRFKCTYKNPERVVLSQTEIDTMMSAKFIDKRLEQIRDVFIFCCYTGFAYTDVFNLKPKDLVKGIDGENWLTIYRQKTGERESVPLLPIPLEIVRKYQDNSICIRKEKLLPVMSNQKYNQHLKTVGALCKIEKTLTSHIARHTFATTVTLSNGVPIETVSKMLGHTRLVTTQIYAKVLDHKISSDMKALKEKLAPTEEKTTKIVTRI